MLTMFRGKRSELESVVEAELASYRHRVFVETLGWKLLCEKGFERDQFDREDTVYIIAREPSGVICGCARLLPTVNPYLLAEVFPGLLNGMPAPCDIDTWELSRFSTQSPMCANGVLNRDEARRRFRMLFSTVVETASDRGASRLITFTALGIERILRNIGMHAHRVGPPQLIDGVPVLALWIELDDQTRLSLGLSPALQNKPAN